MSRGAVPTAGRPRRRAVPFLPLVVAVLVVAAAGVVGPLGPDGDAPSVSVFRPGPGPSGEATRRPAPTASPAVPTAAGTPAIPVDEVLAEARSFLDAYVDGDGRVVRRDQGGDTVSEGQAYAMLLTVALDDRDGFENVWGWTRANILRADGLLSWRWADGEVVEPEAASDADLDTAWALALAHRRWPDAGFGESAAAIAAAVVERETAQVGGRRVLAAGPWAVGGVDGSGVVVVNPSYSSPVALEVLAADGFLDPAVADEVARGDGEVIDALVDAGGVPSDWARLGADGSIRSARGPLDGEPGWFGWDAVRVPLRYAASCQPGQADRAGAMWSAIELGAGADVMGEHPARLVAAAASAASRGDGDQALTLLDRATESQDAAPTYYGGALTALGQVLLATDLLGGCPPL